MVSITIIDINPSLMFFRSEEKIKLRFHSRVKITIRQKIVANFTIIA